MNKELEEKTKEWMELGRKTQKQRETAENKANEADCGRVYPAESGKTV